MKKNKDVYFFYESENEDDIVSVQFEKRIELIYEKLADDISRNIFTNRLLYSLTKDYRHIYNTIMTTKMGRKLNSLLENKILGGGRLYIWCWNTW